MKSLGVQCQGRVTKYCKRASYPSFQRLNLHLTREVQLVFATLWVVLSATLYFIPPVLPLNTEQERNKQEKGKGRGVFPDFNFFSFVSSLTTVTNKLQPASLNNHQPTALLGDLAFMYPLKSSQNSKHHTLEETLQLTKPCLCQSMRQILVSCCGQSKAAPHSCTWD